MKIGVLTHSGSDDNYGQIMQAFALQKYLIGKGHDTFLIKYSSDNDKSKDSFAWIKDIIRFFLRLISKKRRDSYNYIKYLQTLSKENIIKNEKRQFKKFLEDNINLTRIYSSYAELQSDYPQADVYIVGSDQVWNPSLHNPTTAAWYLQFGDAKTKRISYAASIGRSINEDEKAKFLKYLSIFDGISIREESSCQYCQNIGLKNSKLVVDPTILAPFSVYEPYINKEAIPSKSYAFLYYLNVETKEELAWSQLHSFINREGLNLRTVSSSGYFPAQSLIPGYDNEYLTIPEWLTAIYHSKCVITTSFHGVVLSILMHKPFVAIPLTNQYKSGNVRLVSLLNDLGLSDRLLSESRTIDSILHSDINWSIVDSLLSEKKKSSELFLDDVLK